MAQMIPTIRELDDHPSELTVGELQILDALTALDDSWTVYVQPLLGWDQPGFVVAHPDFGVCAMKVEDWAVGSRRQACDGRIEARSATGWEPVSETPCTAAARYRTAILELFHAEPGLTDELHDRTIVRGIVVLASYTTADACALLRRPHMVDFENWIKVWGGQALKDDPVCVVAGHPRPARREVSPICLDRLHAHCSQTSDAARLLVRR